MAKAKEIKYNILNKTTNNHGVFYFTKDNVNYIGNSFVVIRGMNNDEFELAIEKSKAEKLDRDSTIDIVVNHVEEVKEKGLNAIYTKFCFNTSSGLVHFFKLDNGIIVNLYDKFYSLLKEQQVTKITGISSKCGLVFELNDGKEFLILPMKLKLNGSEAKILEKVLDSIN